MKKLKTISHYKSTYLFLFIFLIIYIYLRLSLSNETSPFICTINNISYKDTNAKLNITCQNDYITYYYFNNKEEQLLFKQKYKVKDKIKIVGKVENNTIKIQEISLVKKGIILTKFRTLLEKRIEKLETYKYLYLFLFRKSDYLEKSNYELYKSTGINYLFSISSLYITILSSIFNKIFNIKDRYKTTFAISFIFYFLTKSIGIFRLLIYSLISYLSVKFNLKLDIKKKLFITFLILLIINPFYINNIGFWYALIVSTGLIMSYKRFTKINNYLLRNIVISFYAFLLSLPLSIYLNYELNICSFLIIGIMYPIFTFIYLPLSLLTVVFPFLDSVLLIFINILNKIISILNTFSVNIILMKINIIVILIYYLIILLVLHNKKNLIILVFIIYVHTNYNSIFKSTFVAFIDVGQGDSSLIHSGNSNILIDTGGLTFNNDYSLSIYKTIPLLKSLGIKKINTLVITHGDFDHMGGSINLVNNFKVEKVIFNCGPYNDLEKELIKVLDKKHIQYYSCIKELNIDKNKLYFLQTKEYDNENDNSNVIYTELNGYKFMFMGDASIMTEKEILDKYNLPDIDVLKVGHHGSKTSSSKEFINEINLKYSVISVGKNNRYGHPNKEVLENLEKSKIYRTDQDGSIMFKMKNNKLKIETCST